MSETPSKKLTQPELHTLRERLKVVFDKEFGSTAKCFSIGFGSNADGRQTVAVRVQLSRRQFDNRRIRRQTFERFQARFPKEFEGVPLQVAFLGPLVAHCS